MCATNIIVHFPQMSKRESNDLSEQLMEVLKSDYSVMEYKKKQTNTGPVTTRVKFVPRLIMTPRHVYLHLKLYLSLKLDIDFIHTLTKTNKTSTFSCNKTRRTKQYSGPTKITYTEYQS